MSGRQAAVPVTPVILTFNEAPNLARALDGLAWASRVVVVDSGSTDETEAIARRYSNVQWVVRPFDSHGAQWRFAVHETGIDTPYVLALDADYAVPPAFAAELRDAFVPAGAAGGVAGFEYRIHGRALRGSVYPAKVVVFRRDAVRIAQHGHTQEVSVTGATYRFAARLVHDDRKPLSRFVASQLAYAKLEVERLSRPSARRWQDRLRLTGLMPAVAAVAGYLSAGGPLSGTASLRYAYERAIFECLVASELIGRRLLARTSTAPATDAAAPDTVKAK